MKRTQIDPPVLDIVADSGIPFRVRYLAVGAQDGQVDGKPVTVLKAQVEFYDRRYEHTEHGLFTGGRYYVSSLISPRFTTPLPDGEPFGLNLHGGVPGWTLDGRALSVVLHWLMLVHERNA